MQDLINRAEAKYPHVRYEDELADHLEGRAHPLPHPERYCHGYTKNDPVWITTIDGKQFTVEEWAKLNAPLARKHPGPITMEEHSNWNLGAIIAFLLLSAFWSAPWWWPRLFK